MIMNLVEVKEFSFAYPECSRKVLDHANLKIEEGTLNVICGRSGCGKSTLLRQLKTVLAPVGKSEGEIFYRGMPLSGIKPPDTEPGDWFCHAEPGLTDRNG